MALTRLILENFRGFKDLDLEFHPRLTVFVGSNGSGKTSVLDAAAGAAGAFQFRPTDVRAGSDHGSMLLVTTRGQTKFSMTPAGNLRVDSDAGFTRPFMLYYGVNRSADDQTPGLTEARNWSAGDASSNWGTASADYSALFQWLREMEDLENEQIRHGEVSVQPQLELVRRAVTSFLPSYVNLRVRRMFPPMSQKPVLTLEKDGIALPFDAFSEGERNSIAMVADIARRLALLSLNGKVVVDPLSQEGTILIDEVEQHLHPGWQRQLIRQLPKTFPGLQFVMTTQSPVVVSEVAAESLRVLRNFALVEAHHRQGRDANSVLEDTFSTSSRPPEVEQQFDTLADRLDERDLTGAEPILRSLESQLGATDPDVIYYRNILERIRPG